MSASRIDETREFIPVRIAVLTVSDTRKLDEDKSGASSATNGRKLRRCCANGLRATTSMS
jgi:hypothetical protein